MVTEHVIDQYFRLKEKLREAHPECIGEAERLAHDAEKAGDLAPDDYWDKIWDKPIWANNRVKTAQRKIDDLRPPMLNAWRNMGDTGGPYEIQYTGQGKNWISVESYEVLGCKAKKIVLAPHRLLAIVGAGTVFRERRDRYSEGNPFQDLFALEITELEEKLRIIKREFGRGWGFITALHFLTDLGMACKPDRTVCRSVNHLGFVGSGDILDRVPSRRDTILINKWVRGLARGAEGELSAHTLRYTDKILMEISRNEIFDAGKRKG